MRERKTSMTAINYKTLAAANADSGTLPHLVSDLFQAQASVEFVQVPFMGKLIRKLGLKGG